MSKKPLIILTGPTAVGKTAASIRLAKAVNGEIVSADSMQIYRYMDVGTAKIRREEMQGVPHHLIDEIAPDTSFHVYEFKRMAERCMDGIYSRGQSPIVVGGTGFSIQALLYYVEFCEEEPDRGYREELARLADEKGAVYLHQKLREVDADAAADIHPNNVKRVIRALEYYRGTGAPISAHNRAQRQRESPYRFLYFVLTMDRSELYRRIDGRVEKMFESGLLEEFQMLLEKGYRREMTSMQAIGYRELFAYADGQISLDEAKEQIKRDTRHFAKRQLTWFRREREVIFLDRGQYDNEAALVDDIIRRAEGKQII